MSKSPIIDTAVSAPTLRSVRITESIIQTLVSPVRALLIILFITVITHLPSGFASFIADDFMQWAMLKGSPVLHELGFEKAQPDKPLAQGLLDGFHFFSAGASTLDTYRTYGNLPWWSGDDISMVPFRPLAALTHWFDYTWFQDRLWLHQLHSLAYYLLLSALLYVLYRKLALHPETCAKGDQQSMMVVAALATLMVIVDFSLTRSFLWVVARNSYMACAIGVGSLICFIHWREQNKVYWLLASMLLFVAALLTAEAALAVAAYMGAYVLCMERKSLLRKFIILLPVIAVILLWRYGYSQQGFGALNIAQYIDPARSPLEFGANVLFVFPLIVFSLMTGLDSLIVFFHPTQQWIPVALAWGFTLLGILLIRPLLRRNAVDRFWFIGSIVAAIPGTALISAESRTMTFVAIGFFYLLAKLIMVMYSEQQRLSRRWGFRFLLGWHLFLPLVVSVLLTSGQLGYTEETQQPRSVAGYIEEGKTGLVIVNPQTSGLMYYLPFEWAFRHYPVPGRMSILTTGLETSELTRVGDRTFIISAPAGMPLSHHAPIKRLDGAKSPTISGVYSVLHAQSFFTTPDQQHRPGDVILNADTRITILSRNEVGPTKLQVEFIGAEHPDQKVWQWFDWKTQKYQRLEPLDLNETQRFVGPMDNVAPTG